jgi:hypothetical protein
MSRGKREPKREFTDLYRQVLDHAVLDADDWLCGVVDDLEVEGDVGGSLRVTALLVGPGAWVPRLPALLKALLPKLVGTRCVRVPWSEVCVVGEHIRLQSRAAELGLGIADRKLGVRLGKIPGSERGD